VKTVYSLKPAGRAQGIIPEAVLPQQTKWGALLRKFIHIHEDLLILQVEETTFLSMLICTFGLLTLLLSHL
jgi:hypothetical protein